MKRTAPSTSTSASTSTSTSSSDEGQFHRDFRMLYAHSSTLTCATDHHCIPCLYKIFPDGSAFGFTLPPNQRPEMCGRSSTTDTSIAGLYQKPEVLQSQDNIKGKKSSSTSTSTNTSTSPAILTIGDGDFSFSLSLSKCLEVDTFVATSYESQESVLSVYKNSRKNIEDLKCKGVKVKHLVDGKDIQETLSDEKYENAFDFIIWNFPCIRAAGGGDAQVADIDENKDLVRRFFSSAKQFLRKTSSGYRGGEIHVTHKTFEPFCWWDILALGVDAGLEYRGSMVFDRYLYPGYVNRKALDNKSFPFIDAQTYIFTERQEEEFDLTDEKGCSDQNNEDILKGRQDMVDLRDDSVLLALENAVKLVVQSKARKDSHKNNRSVTSSTAYTFKKKKLH